MMHRRDLLLQEGSYLLRLQTTLTSRAAAIDAKKCYWNSEVKQHSKSVHQQETWNQALLRPVAYMHEGTMP